MCHIISVLCFIQVHSFSSVSAQSISCDLITFENFVFQTEPVNINEESEGIDQNTQIRNQGIIALSYRDWEVKLRTLPPGWFCLPRHLF